MVMGGECRGFKSRHSGHESQVQQFLCSFTLLDPHNSCSTFSSQRGGEEHGNKV